MGVQGWRQRVARLRRSSAPAPRARAPRGLGWARQRCSRPGRSTCLAAPPRVRSHCRFIIRGTEHVREPSVKRMSGGTKRQCDRALAPPRSRWPPRRRAGGRTPARGPGSRTSGAATSACAAAAASPRKRCARPRRPASGRRRRAAPRVRSHCRFRKGIEYVCEYGTKWMSRALAAP